MVARTAGPPLERARHAREGRVDMSATAHPMPSTPLPRDAIIDQLMALARNASRNVEEHDPIDYWYRLGQRNAYAHATAQLLAPELAQDPFTIAERITTALDAGAIDIAELREAAYGRQSGAALPKPALEWVGP